MKTNFDLLTGIKLQFARHVEERAYYNPKLACVQRMKCNVTRQYYTITATCARCHKVLFIWSPSDAQIRHAKKAYITRSRWERYLEGKL